MKASRILKHLESELANVRKSVGNKSYSDIYNLYGKINQMVAEHKTCVDVERLPAFNTFKTTFKYEVLKDFQNIAQDYYLGLKAYDPDKYGMYSGFKPSEFNKRFLTYCTEFVGEIARLTNDNGKDCTVHD